MAIGYRGTPGGELQAPKQVLDDDDQANWVIKVNRWPRNVELRRGVLSGVWADIPALVGYIDDTVFDADGTGIPGEQHPEDP
jgi:hypothetical protein